MFFGWWTILDTHGKLLSMKNPAVLQFLTQTSMPVTWPFQRHLNPLNGTHTIHVSNVSRLKNPSLPFIYTLIEVDLTSDINKGS
jgi:hypothetical protein